MARPRKQASGPPAPGNRSGIGKGIPSGIPKSTLKSGDSMVVVVNPKWKNKMSWPKDVPIPGGVAGSVKRGRR